MLRGGSGAKARVIVWGEVARCGWELATEVERLKFIGDFEAQSWCTNEERSQSSGSECDFGKGASVSGQSWSVGQK